MSTATPGTPGSSARRRSSGTFRGTTCHPPIHPPGRRSAAAGPGPGSATWGTTAAGYVRQYTDFIAAVRTGAPPAVTGADGRAALEIVTAAYEASRTGRAVVLGEAGR